MSVSDAEKAFYEQVLSNPDGHTISDLRYAFFLAGLSGGIPVVDASELEGGNVPVWDADEGRWVPGDGGSGPVAVPEGLDAGGTPGITTFLRGDGEWAAVPMPAVISQANIQNLASTTPGSVSGQRFSQGFMARLAGLPGFDDGETQTLKNTSGSFNWVTDE